MYVQIDLTLQRKDDGIKASMQLFPAVDSKDGYVYSFSQEKLWSCLNAVGVTADKFASVEQKEDNILLVIGGKPGDAFMTMVNSLEAFDAGRYEDTEFGIVIDAVKRIEQDKELDEVSTTHIGYVHDLYTYAEHPVQHEYIRFENGAVAQKKLVSARRISGIGRFVMQPTSKQLN